MSPSRHSRHYRLTRPRLRGASCGAALWLTLCTAGPLAGPAQAQNPFAPRTVAERGPVSPSAGTRHTSSNPTALATGNGMPPGTPVALAQQVAPLPGGASEAGPRPAPRDLLELLSVSSIVGQRVLFRLPRLGPQAQPAGAPGALSSLAQPLGSPGMAPMMSTASGAMVSFVLVKAQDRKPFLLGAELYIAVVDGFSVTLYRASDRELRLPVWTGEPGPVPTLVLQPSLAEFSTSTPPPAPSTSVPPSVLPSATFANGAAPPLGNNGGSNGSGNTGTGNNGAAR